MLADLCDDYPDHGDCAGESLWLFALYQRSSCDVECDVTPPKDDDLRRSIGIDGGSVERRKSLIRITFIVIGSSGWNIRVAAVDPATSMDILRFPARVLVTHVARGC